MKNLFSWLEQRTTGAVGFGKGLLHESIPGGAKWRYSWVTLLLFSYILQAITGFFIWMFYAPSTQTAWESIYYLQNQVPGGWLLRALHHYTAQVVVVLTALHLLQMIIYKAYQAPRELNFWLVLLLLPLVMGLSVTGWLLPYDQRGFWASRVPLNILSIIPVMGPKLARVLIGGKDFGHHTLTHFLALHAGLLPLLTFIVLFAHYFLYRRLGLSQVPAKSSSRGTTYFPDQLLRDAVVCLALVGVLLFIILRGATGGTTGLTGVEIGAPADPTEPYAAARPEWFMLFLFQLLKFFPGGTEIIGAVIIPTIVMGVIAAMPFIGKWNYGHRFNLLFTGALVVGALTLTAMAFRQDGADVAFQNAKKEARIAGERTQVLASSPQGIPPTGALGLLRNDAFYQGPRLFAKNCSSCHLFDGHDGMGMLMREPPTASDLKDFGTRKWIAGLLDPARVDTAHYFGATKFKEGKMVKFVKKDIAKLTSEEKPKLQKLINALSAEAHLKSQKSLDSEDEEQIKNGRELLTEMRCTECHVFHKKDEDATAPDLTNYASREWLIRIISNPNHPSFYGQKNDRMPAFAEMKLLDAQSIALIADWLRGDWYEPSDNAQAEAP